ncbi:helix-turn-helix domain-containing protein [Sinorhizobium meliloti]|uniref:helix-turn-helix domain-containing protein n=1 Tax=Rhizobium meliloti TaxID=382 RepID=UPI003D650D2B
MSNLGTPTFEQLRVFLAVVDSGSVAGAACKLNHAVLVITYGVANLKSQLDLDYSSTGTRKPQLTAAGRSRPCMTGWK